MSKTFPPRQKIDLKIEVHYPLLDKEAMSEIQKAEQEIRNVFKDSTTDTSTYFDKYTSYQRYTVICESLGRKRVSYYAFDEDHLIEVQNLTIGGNEL